MSTVLSKPSINTNPILREEFCPYCTQKSLGYLKLCEGATGKIKPENYGRRYQVCGNPSCERFYWRDPPTPLALLPEDVQLRIARQQSIADVETLTCGAPGCLTSGNNPRRANRLCERDPAHCSQCCKNAGGCRIHKSGAGDGNPPGPALDGQPEDPSFDVGLSNAAGTAPFVRSSFARPLHEGYTHYLEAHLARETINQALGLQRKAELDRQNTVLIALWKEKHEGPKLFEVISSQPGFLIPINHAIIVSKLDAGVDEICVLHTLPRVEWIHQTLRVPIRVTSGARVLLRSPDLTEKECAHLDEEMARVLSDSSYVSQRGDSINDVSAFQPSTSSVFPPTSASSFTSVSMGAERGTLSHSKVRQVLAPYARPDSPLPNAKFPLKYTFEMERGLRAMGAVKGEAEILDAFHKNFPDSRTVGRSTAFKCRKIFMGAIEIGIFDASVKAGATPEGSWATLKVTVEESLKHRKMQKAAMPSNQEPSESPDIELDDFVMNTRPDEAPRSEDMNYEIFDFTYEEFQWSDGQLVSLVTARDLPALYLMDTSFTGSMKEIHLMDCMYKDALGRAFAAKRIHLPDTWYSACGSLEVAMWLEASRLDACHAYQVQFHAALQQKNCLAFPFEVLPTFLIRTNTFTEFAQPWSTGSVFERKLLPRDLPTSLTLDAFSHFTYVFTEGKLVLTDFQGHILDDGSLRIFDCTTHTLDDDGNERFYLKNRFKPALKSWIDEHRETCLNNPVCRALGLSLPDVSL